MSSEYDPELLQELLPTYYKRLFPHQAFYRWLSYGLSEPNIFANREFSMTLMSDVYIRYQSFKNQAELQQEICKKNPHKIDIGPVMSHPPKDHRTTSLFPIQRELVFDIDMTDYDDVRTCCSGVDVCIKCWKFMTIACKIIDAALREDFGFEHILWVFSGRRGIHCWVCDRSARVLNGKQRSAISDYLEIVVFGGENGVTKCYFGEKMHHSVKRAHRIMEPFFEEVCLIEQDIFKTPSAINKLLTALTDVNIKKEFEKILDSTEQNSKSIWEAFLKFVESKREQGIQRNKFKFIKEEMQFIFLYPRIDSNVTKGFNHLLKSPFCIHPKTGKLCIPFNPNVAGKFDPTKVVTINLLLDEINAYEKTVSTQVKDYKKTSMLKGVFVFEDFIRKLENSFKGKSELMEL